MLERRARWGERTRPAQWQVTLLWAGAIGVLGALAAWVFHQASEVVRQVLTGASGSHLTGFSRLAPWARVLVPALGGAAAGVVLHYGMRMARSQHGSDYMEAIVVGDGTVSFRASTVKSVSALLSGATGASIGREGPMVQLSAMLASLVGLLRRFHVLQRRQIVACGAAAGIASAYNAPIAGAFFVSELVLGSTAMEAFGPLVVSTVAATLVTRVLVGPDPLYEARGFTLVSHWEVVPYLLLGGVCGVLAPLYLRFLRRSEGVFARLPIHRIGRMALGGAVVGVLAIGYPEVCGNGQVVVSSLLHESWFARELVVIVALKLIATAATFGSGAVGGVFTPTLLTGAGVGHLFGLGLVAVVPAAQLDPHAYALVGMGAFLAAATGAPIMAIIMLFELTLDYSIVLPLMLASVVAYFSCKPWEQQFLYGEVLERKGAAQASALLAGLQVGDLMKPNPARVPVAAPFHDVAQAFLHNRFAYLYVVDPNDRYVGAISLHDVKEYLDEDEDIDALIAGDLVRHDFPSITAGDSLARAVQAFEQSQSERLPVVGSADDPRLRGSLAKTDLLLYLLHTPQRSAGGDARRAGAPANAQREDGASDPS
jgi:CIC family chloride channel protein